MKHKDHVMETVDKFISEALSAFCDGAEEAVLSIKAIQFRTFTELLLDIRDLLQEIKEKGEGK